MNFSKFKYCYFVNSVVLILVFVAPYLIYAKTSQSIKSFIDVLLLILYILVGFSLRRALLEIKYRQALLFAISFMLFGMLNMIVNSYFRSYNIVAPLAAYIGFVYVNKKSLSPIPFQLLMVFNYVYFYIIYYSLNPVNLLLPEHEFNVEAFTNTSSNLIPVILIINLYIFDILNVAKFKSSQNKFILIFAIINVALILLQRSRAGIVVSIIFLFIKLFKSYRRISYLFILLVLSLAYQYFPLISAYSEAAGSLDADSYSVDVRKENVDIFFDKMVTLKDIIFGYGVKFEFMTSAVTQNLAITIWNYYGILALILVGILILTRFINKKYIPISYYSVFILYSFFEGFFLSNYWDFAIYTLFFFNMNSVKESKFILSKN